MSSRAATVIRFLRRAAAAVVLTLLLAFGYGTPAGDHARVQAFVDACPRWQHDPDFRLVQQEYVRTGSAAMNARVALVPATRVIMALRSLPGLPATLAANEGSRQHYADFAAGELASYFRLSGEQGTDWVIPVLEELCCADEPSDAQLREFLKKFQTDEPLAMDAGAIAGLQRLIADVRPQQRLQVRRDVPARLRAASQSLARQMGLPLPAQMTPAQQQACYSRLDDYVRQSDPELWRAKQVNDFLCGVWAQTFGQTYARWIGPIAKAWYAVRLLGPLWLAAWLLILLRPRQLRKKSALPR